MKNNSLNRQIGKITQLTTNNLPSFTQKPNQIDFDYVRLRTQTLMSEVDLSTLSKRDIRKISLCMEDIAINELSRC